MTSPCVNWLCCCSGVGDKRILRELLASLGLSEAAGREKRAIQFGSRIGQLSNKRDFGSGRQANKKQAGSLLRVPAAPASGTSAATVSVDLTMTDRHVSQVQM